LPCVSFELRERDLLARIGRLRTKGGTIETPLLLPVINPAVQPVSPRSMKEEFGCGAVITNAYIVRRQFGDRAVQEGIHRLLGFQGPVMTDSGAYQILRYGDVDITPEEAVRYQEEIGTDIATILDVPTGWGAPEKRARYTVEETLRRARGLFEVKTREDIAWVGPVQGGPHLELVAQSAREMAKLPFQVHALGSPTQVMEQYLFHVLADMILTAKRNLPPDRPLHLFGAGHPLTFSLAVALGCDLFDSAAYAIYARQGRYMTEHGTLRLSELQYFPCPCPVCAANEPREVAAMPEAERAGLLARHNLHACLSETRRIKQAIAEGRLWEHLEARAHGHPSLLRALKGLERHRDYLEELSPVTKGSGLFFFGSLGLVRPEVVRHGKRLLERFTPPVGARVLLLLPQVERKPFHRSREHRRALDHLRKRLGDGLRMVHVCTYAAPFGVVPVELDEVYPLSQHEVATPIDEETRGYVAEQVGRYVGAMDYEAVVLLHDAEHWQGGLVESCRMACEGKGVPLLVVSERSPWSGEALSRLSAALHVALKREKGS